MKELLCDGMIHNEKLIDKMIGDRISNTQVGIWLVIFFWLSSFCFLSTRLSKIEKELKEDTHTEVMNHVHEPIIGGKVKR